jgi:NAD(P)-dependent dehydrogenase (short-subunit alcohol dehydrogenase family)
VAHFLSWERGRAERARRGIAAASGSISISYGLADLEDLDAVRAFARYFCATHDRLDVLIQNAGGIHPGFGTDTAGTELTIVGQVVAPFLLTACRCPRWSGWSKPLSGVWPGWRIRPSGPMPRTGSRKISRLSAKPQARPASAFTAATEYSRPR